MEKKRSGFLTAAQVLSWIEFAAGVLFGILFIAAGQIFRDLFGDFYDGLGTLFSGIFIFIGIIFLAVSVLSLLAALSFGKANKTFKVGGTKGWAIFNLVLAGLALLGFMVDPTVAITGFIWPGLIGIFGLIGAKHIAALEQTSNTTTTGGIEAELNNLEALYAKGLISQDEYNQRRANILKR